MYYHNIYFVFNSTKCPDSKETNIIEHNINKYCSSLTYKFWNFNDAKNFIKEHYPYFNDFFNNQMEYPIVKCDFFRYLIMYHFGGIYTDLDFICIRDFNLFLQMFKEKQISYYPHTVEDPSIILSDEWLNSSTFTKTIHNGILISLKEKHPFWLKLLFEIHDTYMNKQFKLTCKDDVFTLSGPKKLLQFYNENKCFFSDVCILPYYYFCPYISIDENNKTYLFNSPMIEMENNKILKWIFFNINQHKDLRNLCPNSFFVCVFLNIGSMWK